MMRTFCIVLLFTGGCGTTKVVQYAEPLPKRVQAPLSVDLSDVSRPWKRKTTDIVDHDVLAPEATAPPEPEKTTAQAIRDANAGSLFDPRDADEDGVVRTWVYDPDVTYQLFACPLEILQIRLAPGEKLVEHPILGNMGSKKSPFWSVLEEMAGDGHAKLIQFVMIRPTREGVPKQRMHLLTNVGPYEFELNVLPKGEECMHGVRFRHPQHELNELALAVEAEQQHGQSAHAGARGTLANDRCASDNYEIEVMEGSPRWVPVRVTRECDGDHARVYITFPDRVVLSKVPSLRTDGGVSDYMFIAAQRKMIVEGLFNNATLSLGSKETGYEKVSIRAVTKEYER